MHLIKNIDQKMILLFMLSLWQFWSSSYYWLKTAWNFYFFSLVWCSNRWGVMPAATQASYKSIYFCKCRYRRSYLLKFTNIFWSWYKSFHFRYSEIYLSLKTLSDPRSTQVLKPNNYNIREIRCFFPFKGM